MTTDPLPGTVRELLSEHIQSVEQLEVLLLLRNSPQRAWTVDEVYEVIRSSHSSIQGRLLKFVSDGFLTEEKGPPQTFRFAPRDLNLHSSVEQTATAYHGSRVRVIEAIFAPEADPAQSFADAFKLRKE